jgi:hypothetical protein
MANNPNIPSVDDVVAWVRNEVQYVCGVASDADQASIIKKIDVTQVESMAQDVIENIAESLGIDY